jgi:hypothetical protein
MNKAKIIPIAAFQKCDVHPPFRLATAPYQRTSRIMRVCPECGGVEWEPKLVQDRFFEKVIAMIAAILIGSMVLFALWWGW